MLKNMRTQSVHLGMKVKTKSRRSPQSVSGQRVTHFPFRLRFLSCESVKRRQVHRCWSGESPSLCSSGVKQEMTSKCSSAGLEVRTVRERWRKKSFGISYGGRSQRLIFPMWQMRTYAEATIRTVKIKTPPTIAPGFTPASV